MKKPVFLVVDDKKDNREILVEQLSRLGFASEETEDAVAALQLLGERGTGYFAAILLDWMMPGMSGLKMVHDMQNIPEIAQIPVVLVTARTDTASRQLAKEAGVCWFLAKPFNRQELAQVINTIIPGENP